MEEIPEFLRPGIDTSDSPNAIPVQIFQSDSESLLGSPVDHNSPVDNHCPCICGLCCCKVRVIPPPTGHEAEAEAADDDDNETIGPLSSIRGPPSTIGPSTVGPYVTNVDPFNKPRTEPSEEIEPVIEDEPPLPIPPYIEPIGDPAFTPILMSPVQANPILSPPADPPQGLDVFQVLSPLPLEQTPSLTETPPEGTPQNFPSENQWQDPEQTPPPPRPDFSMVLEDPPDFPPVHRKTMQLVLRVKPVFVDCLDALYDILPKLDELSAVTDVQSKQDVCLDLEECLKTLWFILPPKHSCDDTMDCRHWHQRFIERIEQLAEKLVSFLDELRTPMELNKFSFRMDQYRRVFEKWIKKFEQYHALIRINPDP
ncbi:hypothetical protein VKT23_000385 [Stygiomarasmius scandens]|uniref:Uncharacterized protein n=1 Tax=Marasmiellus scandens TaxID=2682957 RepID=A0ABR1IQC4_9AGAR